MELFLDFVENMVSQKPSDRTLKCAAESFAVTLKKIGSDEISKETVEYWIVSMTVSGIKKSSRRKYIGGLSSIYNMWNVDKEVKNPFESAKSLDIDDNEDGIRRANDNLKYIPSLFKVGRESDEYETISLFLYLLYNIQTGLQDAVNLKFSDDTVAVPQIDDVMESMRMSGRKKYVFGLQQGKKRSGQIVREALHSMHTVLRSYGFDFGGEFSRDAIVALWIAEAVRVGISVADIRSMIDSVPKEYSCFEMVQPSVLTQERRVRILQKVADYINDGASQWFVMKMRQGICPDDIRSAIKTSFGKLHDEMLFYYPTHTVVSRDNKGKKITEEKPYLPGILFFKHRKDKVGELFKRIGNMAWCYRWSNSPDSPYCTISIREMKEFQRHIGLFSSDIRMELVSRDISFSVNQAVKINGGIMDNRIGVIQCVKNNNGTRTYTLALSDREYATWTVEDIEEIYIEPVG